MDYDKIEKGMEVRIVVPNPKFCRNGIVADKQIVTYGDKEVERVYVDTEDRGRRLCAPSVLEQVT
jgi:hypothetical protein